MCTVPARAAVAPRSLSVGCGSCGRPCVWLAPAAGEGSKIRTAKIRTAAAIHARISQPVPRRGAGPLPPPLPSTLSLCPVPLPSASAAAPRVRRDGPLASSHSLCATEERRSVRIERVGQRWAGPYR
eukprot:scaffold55899_cov31-Tisochrysis_lutea.AAC.1